MTNFATRFAEAKSSAEFGDTVLDVIRQNPSGIDPMMALVSIAAEMVMPGSKAQRMAVAKHMRSTATAIEIGKQ